MRHVRSSHRCARRARAARPRPPTSHRSMLPLANTRPPYHSTIKSSSAPRQPSTRLAGLGEMLLLVLALRRGGAARAACRSRGRRSLRCSFSRCMRISPHLTTSHHTSPHLTTPHHTLPHLAASHHISPHLTASHRISPHLTASHRTSPHLTASHRICMRSLRTPCVLPHLSTHDPSLPPPGALPPHVRQAGRGQERSLPRRPPRAKQPRELAQPGPRASDERAPPGRSRRPAALDGRRGRRAGGRPHRP